jgi:hypothetical protein
VRRLASSRQPDTHQRGHPFAVSAIGTVDEAGGGGEEVLVLFGDLAVWRAAIAVRLDAEVFEGTPIRCRCGGAA